MGKYSDILKEYNLSKENAEIQEIIKETKEKSTIIENKELMSLLSCIDLTSLNTTDTEKEINELVEKVNRFSDEFNDLPPVASICTFPVFIGELKRNLTEKRTNICTVTGFPNPQTYLEVKIAETALAVSEGAEEIDTVISVSKLLEEKYDEVGEEIEEIKHACREAKLKVILETGAYKNNKQIYTASIIAMYAGADFIKTSTGKYTVNATPEAAIVMCQAIRDFYEKTQYKVGFKAAGGIKTIEEVLQYLKITEQIAGKEWIGKNYFRIGTSKLTNTVLSTLKEKEINYF
ncbi:MAG: deoxyribose-phosphate aldolase [Candidatus Azobacteroides sp.]|nr:deoxyribose-phosphate aldolase [Candidatus Azobacteroides sp.]